MKDSSIPLICGALMVFCFGVLVGGTKNPDTEISVQVDPVGVKRYYQKIDSKWVEVRLVPVEKVKEN